MPAQTAPSPAPYYVSRNGTPAHSPEFTLYDEDGSNGGRGRRVAIAFGEDSARFLAAAPALLAALRALVRATSDGDDCPCCGIGMSAHVADSDRAEVCECPITLARAAIAAAEQE